MNMTFITDYTYITYEYYIKQPKHMVEWELNKKLCTHLELIRAFDRNSHHPLIRKYGHIDNEVIDDI